MATRPPMATTPGRSAPRMRSGSCLRKPDAEVFFAFNGTAANSLALASLCQSYHSVICSSSAHVETDECGAPEFFSNGSKLLIARQRGRQADAGPGAQPRDQAARTFIFRSRAW